MRVPSSAPTRTISATATRISQVDATGSRRDCSVLVRLLSAHRILTLLAAVAALALAACTLGTPGSGEVAQPAQGRPAAQGTLPAIVATAVAPALVPTPTARPTLAPTVVPTATPL